MEGEMISGAPRVVVNGGDQGRKVWKFLFIAQEADEFNSAEFTVSVDVAIQQVCFEHAPPLFGDGGAHAQTGHTGQRAIGQAMCAHNINSIAQRTGFGDVMVQRAITDAAANFLTVYDSASDAIGVPQQALRTLKVALS